MKNNSLTKSLILISMLVAGLPTSNLGAASHKLEISLQNCSLAKKFAKAVMEKRKSLRPLNYYEQIEFTSPVAMEIVLEAYSTDKIEPDFSDEWFEKCLEISCDAFWSDLDIAVSLISD